MKTEVLVANLLSQPNAALQAEVTSVSQEILATRDGILDTQDQVNILISYIIFQTSSVETQNVRQATLLKELIRELSREPTENR